VVRAKESTVVRQRSNPISQIHDDTAVRLAQLAATYSDGAIALLSAEDRAALAGESYRISRYIDVLRCIEKAARHVRDDVRKAQRPSLRMVRDE
jgi:hypothetical protein